MSSKLQSLARKENYALFILKGIRASANVFVRPVVDRETFNRLMFGIDMAIEVIKLAQKERNPKRKIKP